MLRLAVLVEHALNGSTENAVAQRKHTARPAKAARQGRRDHAAGSRVTVRSRTDTGIEFADLMISDAREHERRLSGSGRGSGRR